MNWSDEPATEQQLRYLQQCGHVTTRPLTRSDAAGLIRELREHPAARAMAVSASHEAFRLRTLVDQAKKGLTGNGPDGDRQSAIALAVKKREEFWLDTCREPTQMHEASPSVFEFHQTYGCRFLAPTHEQVREVLQALDSALSTWEHDHPELFYQTLELNFPELVKR